MTSPAPPQVQAAVATLRARHERVTPARLAVLEVLAGAEGHLTADDIVELAADRAPGVHRATVYRALSTLGELDMVIHTHVGGSAAVYHLTAPVPATPQEAGPPTHAHLQCTSCGAVIDVPTATLAPLGAALQRDLGFRLQPEHAALLGTCVQCRKPDHGGTTAVL